MIFAVSAVGDISENELRQAHSLLSGEQQAYIAAKPEKNALQSLGARALLARLAGEAILLTLKTGKDGRPSAEGLNISLSHSGDFVAAAISDRPVGIDIQLKRAVSPKTVRRVCTPDEIRFTEDEPDGFFTVWTLKEAYIKAAQKGFADVVSISFIENGVPCPPCARYECERRGDLFISVIEL